MRGHHFNSKESLEVIRQNINFANSLISSAENQETQLELGQWIDVKDTIDQWLEAQVTKKRVNQVFVHYNGWGNQWDEWIDVNSPRIAPFRKYTLQYPSSRYVSPSPNLQTDAEDHEIPHYDTSFSDMLAQASVMVSRMQEFINGYLSLINAPKNEEIKDVSAYKEKKKKIARLIAPFIDRSSRILCDLAPHFAHFADPETYRDDSEQNSEALNEEESKNVQTNMQIPLIANPGDVSAVSNLLDRILFGDVPCLEFHIHSFGNSNAGTANNNIGNANSIANSNSNNPLSHINVPPDSHSESGINEIQTEVKPEIAIQTENPIVCDASCTTESICMSSVGVQTIDDIPQEETKIVNEISQRDTAKSPKKQKSHVGHIIIRQSPKINREKYVKAAKEFKITKTNIRMGINKKDNIMQNNYEETKNN